MICARKRFSCGQMCAELQLFTTHCCALPAVQEGADVLHWELEVTGHCAASAGGVG